MIKIKMICIVLLTSCAVNAQFVDEITKEQIHSLGLTGVCYQDIRRTPNQSTIDNSTSFFIARNFLLTSGHNVTKLLFHNAKTLTIYPARIHDSKEFDSIKINIDYDKNIRYPDAYGFHRPRTRKPHDMALIYIPDSQIDANPKLKEIAYLPLLEDTAGLRVGDTLYCAGYPAAGEYENQYVMTMDTSTVKTLENGFFSHDLKTVTGNSGSPIMVKRNSRFFVVGINSIRYDGTWLNDEKKALIKRWMAELKTATTQ